MALDARLRALLDSAVRTVSVVEVSGDRWMGKTTLIADFGRLAAGRGWMVASGYAVPALTGVPFGLFADALDDLLVRFGEELVGGVAGHHVRRLAEIFPALGTVHGDPVVPAAREPADPTETYQIFRAVRGLLESLGSLRPLLLTMDDVHWADAASVELLGHLLRHPPDGRVVLAVAYRPQQVDCTLRSQLSEAVANGTVCRITPGPLIEEQALALLPGDLSRVHCEALLREAGGNPGLLRGLASVRAVPGPAGSAPPRLPLDVLADCLRDFRGLSATGWLVARSAAVLDEPFEPNMVKKVAQISDAELWAGLDELIEEDLVGGEQSSRRLRFRNLLLRAAAYQSAGTGWLLGAHSRATELLTVRGDSTARLARHLDRSAVIGDAASARVLRDAAPRHLWDDPLTAASWASTAMELGGHDRDSPLELRVLLGAALALAGKLDDSLRALDDLGAAAEASAASWVQAVRWRSWVHRLLGRHDEAGAELTAALSLTFLGEQSRALLILDRMAVALECRQGLPEADEAILNRIIISATPAVGAAVLALLACHTARAGQLDRAADRATAAAELFDQLPDDEVVEHLDGLLWLACTETTIGATSTAVAHYERGLELAERRRLISLVPQFAIALGGLQLRLGDLDGAARHAACARAAAETMNSGHLLAHAVALDELVAAAVESAAVPVPQQRPPTTGQQAHTARLEQARTELESLSERELEIALLVSDGRTNQQIARTLALSHKTVETYLGRIFKKLDVSSRAEVAAMVGRADGAVRFSASTR